MRRAAGKGGPLVYIGQTARGLRERLLALAAGVNAAECPFNDPHTAAPHLWLLRTVEGAQLECSSVPLAIDSRRLRATEDFLLWRHRAEAGCSTEANHGRFLPGYSRPTNRWVVTGQRRSPGRRAQAEPEALLADHYAKTHPALQGSGRLLDEAWWNRCPIREAAALPAQPAVYAIHGHGPEELTPIYLGETSNLAGRAKAHALAAWPIAEPVIAYRLLPKGTPKHVLLELESDLLGWHFAVEDDPPLMQYQRSGRGEARTGPRP